MYKYCLFAFILFFEISVQAQSLTSINIDDLSDAQILSIYEKGRSQGFNIEDGQEMAMNMGLSNEEALKFKTRLALLQDSKLVEPESLKSNIDIPIKEIEDPKENEEKENLSSNIFGHNYFYSDLKSFDKVDGAKAPNNYLLGSGDEITVSIFGSSYFQQTFRVSEFGILNLGPKFGRLNIQGMVFERVEKLLRARFSRGFDLSKNTFNLSLSYGRKIVINIIGEVNNPGTYSLSALNNAFHALSIAGGANEFGSLRNVKIYRDGDVIEIIDFYKFFLNPDGFKIPYLQDGDFLMVPTMTNLVTATGAFKRNMQFEMLSNETVSELINFSSGFSQNAYRKKIQIFRNNDDKMEIIDVELKDFSSFNLTDGDSIHSNFKNGKLQNFVTIDGALAQPGTYGFIKGMTLQDLIDLAGGVVGRYINKELVLSRVMPDGYYGQTRISLTDKEALEMKLSSLDDIFIGFKTVNSNKKTVSVVGAVHNPMEMIYSRGMTLEDALIRAGGLQLFSDNERIEITRQKFIINERGYQEIVKSSKVLSLDALSKENWSNEYEKSDYLLEPFDEISVRRIKNYGTNQSVLIFGAVEFPGSYTILSENERVSDVISRAGGVSDGADISNAMFYRNKNDYVVVNLKMAIARNQNNYLLQDSDSIFVPKKSEIIEITGDGHNYFKEFGDSTLKVPRINSLRSYDYVNEYTLGLSRNARKKDIYVSYPNGKLDRSKNILLFWNLSPKVKSGGVIHVNKKAIKPKELKNRKPIDWNQVVATLTSAAMGFGTVYALINRP